MKCPNCDSDNVECQEDSNSHVHLCHDCGHEDWFKGDAS